MADFPYTTNPASLKKFFDHIQKAGVPPKVTQQYLSSVGFKSTNDRPILAVLKTLAFTDGSGVPTDAWRRYRNKEEARAVLAAAIKATYPNLFSTYPDAHRKDNEALRNYFSTHTTVGEGALNFMVRTFKALCDLADFDAPTVTDQKTKVPTAKLNADEDVPPLIRTPTGLGSSGMTININVQLQLPATEDSSVYDKLFAAMKKHLIA